MSIRATAWAWTVDTTSTGKLVLLALADHADETGFCWPSVPRLARMTCLTERAVITAIQALERGGVMTCDRRPGKPTRYSLNVGKVPVSPPPPPAEPLNDVHPCTTFTPEADAGNPCTTFTPPLNDVHGTPERRSPEPSRTIIEPPVNRQSEARGTRLPADWWPTSADQTFARDLGLAPERVAGGFRDYWHGAAGAKGRKTDWSATWRNWCRRDAERAPKPGRDPRSKIAWIFDDPMFGDSPDEATGGNGRGLDALPAPSRGGRS